MAIRVKCTASRRAGGGPAGWNDRRSSSIYIFNTEWVTYLVGAQVFHRTRQLHIAARRNGDVLDDVGELGIVANRCKGEITRIMSVLGKSQLNMEKHLIRAFLKLLSESRELIHIELIFRKLGYLISLNCEQYLGRVLKALALRRGLENSLMKPSPADHLVF